MNAQGQRRERGLDTQIKASRSKKRSPILYTARRLQNNFKFTAPTDKDALQILSLYSFNLVVFILYIQYVSGFIGCFFFLLCEIEK